MHLRRGSERFLLPRIARTCHRTYWSRELRPVSEHLSRRSNHCSPSLDDSSHDRSSVAAHGRALEHAEDSCSSIGSLIRRCSSA